MAFDRNKVYVFNQGQHALLSCSDCKEKRTEDLGVGGYPASSLDKAIVAHEAWHATQDVKGTSDSNDVKSDVEDAFAEVQAKLEEILPKVVEELRPVIKRALDKHGFKFPF
jgi:hypothetical protein